MRRMRVLQAVVAIIVTCIAMYASFIAVSVFQDRLEISDEDKAGRIGLLIYCRMHTVSPWRYYTKTIKSGCNWHVLVIDRSQCVGCFALIELDMQGNLIEITHGH